MQVFYFFLARALPAVINLGSVLIYTRLLPASEYGLFSISVAVATCANLALFHWLQAGLQRMYPEYELRGQAHQLINITIVLYGTYWLLMLLTLFVVIQFSMFEHFRRETIYACAVVALLIPAFESSLALTIARGESFRYAALAGAKALAALGVGVALVLALGPHGENLIWGLSIGLVLSTSLFGYQYWKWKPGETLSMWIAARQLMRYGAPLAFALVLSFLTAAGDRLLMGAILGAMAVGLYVPGYDLAHQTIGAIMGTASMALAPSVYRAHANGSTVDTRSKIEQLLFAQLAIGVPVALAMVLASHDLSQLVLHQRYAPDAVAVMRLIAVAALLNYVRAYYFDMAFHISLRTDLLLRILFVAAVISALGNILLLPKFGINVAAIVSVASCALSLLLSALVGRRIYLLPIWAPNVDKVFIAGGSMAALYLVLGITLEGIPWYIRLFLALAMYAAILLASAKPKLASARVGL